MIKKIETRHLFPELNTELIKLLKSLTAGEWEKPSPVKDRTVKDLASHLLDTALRRLSQQRDGFQDTFKKTNISSYNELVEFIQSLNIEWILASRRISPEILVDLLEYAGRELYEYFMTLKPDEKAYFAVAWAGEQESANWFDIAREYTEIWHHQMQIRMALNKSLLMDLKYIEPLYGTFMLGLPHHYRNNKDYPVEETLKITITGKLNKSWYLEKQTEKWTLSEEQRNPAGTEIELSENIAWILFTNTDRKKEKYKNQIKISGNKELGLKLIDYVAVMS